MKRAWIIGFLIVSTLALLGLWFHLMFEYVTEEKLGAPTGPAAYNQLYALERALEEFGVTTERRAHLDFEEMQAEPGDTIVLYGDIRTIGDDQTRLLLEWLGSGGHLLMQLPASENDVETLLLEEIGISVYALDEPIACPRLRLSPSEEPVSIALCSQMRFTDDYELGDRYVEDEHGLIYADIAYGDGVVSVFSSMEFLDNRGLREPANARFLLNVLDANASIESYIYLVYSVDVAPLPMLLWQYGWMVILALLLLLIAWLFNITERFGPMLPVEAQPRRALLEHIAAAAQLLWLKGAAEPMLAALREQIHKRLQRCHPAALGMSPEDCARYLAQLTGLSERRIRAALAPPADTQRRYFEIVSIMLIIRKSL